MCKWGDFCPGLITLTDSVCKVNKKTMIRKRYNRLPHHVPNTKWEKKTKNDLLTFRVPCFALCATKQNKARGKSKRSALSKQMASKLS